MGLVVVCLFPSGIAECDTFMDAAEFRPDDAFDGQRGRLEGVKRHAVTVRLADGLSRNRAMDLAQVFDADVLTYC